MHPVEIMIEQGIAAQLRFFTRKWEKQNVVFRLTPAVIHMIYGAEIPNICSNPYWLKEGDLAARKNCGLEVYITVSDGVWLMCPQGCVYHKG